MKNITTIIFDIGGVLVWTLWEKFTKPVANLTGLTPSEVMKQLVGGNSYHPFMRGEIGRREFHERLAKQFGLELDADSTFKLWMDVIAPHVQIAPLVNSLAGRYRLVLGSNTDELHYAAGLDVQPAFQHFERGILSFDVGHLKPDTEFFRAGLRSLSLSPEECVFTDDRLDNVESARSVGITAFHFESVEQFRTDLQHLELL